MKNPEKLKAWIFIFIVRFSGKREWEKLPEGCEKGRQ